MTSIYLFIYLSQGTLPSFSGGFLCVISCNLKPNQENENNEANQDSGTLLDYKLSPILIVDFLMVSFESNLLKWLYLIFIY